ncbi:TIGR01177 family methyltransferase [Haloglomus litoreum]|uniref:TIGR01177 family methyltransferase n=1 Tax=Haloglomus litoreum TaxID=3034026 RepID=UPI003B221320
MPDAAPTPGVYVLELGGQDDRFARREAESACSAVEPLGTGLATARGVTDRVRGLAFTQRAAELVGRTAPRIEDAVTLLDAAALDSVGQRPTGSRAPPDDREGSVRVRARDVRGLTDIDTKRAERELGQVLVDRGFEVDLEDPDHELRALFAAPPGHDDDDDGTVTIGIDDERDVEVVEHDGAVDTDGLEGLGGDTAPGVCALGWLTAESRRDFGDRQPTDKPFFQPGSMDPLLARALANIAGARPGRTLLDPMCGTGGLLAEGALVGADVVGVDAQWKMVRGASENLEHYLGDSTDADGDESAGGLSGAAESPGEAAVCRGDARRLPIAGEDGEGPIDAVVFDAPYGRQSWASDELSAVVGDALAEARRVARRAVVVGDRPWTEAAETAGWTVTDRFDRRVHGSLVRHILVLTADPDAAPDTG